MSTNRRSFLKQSAAGVASASTLTALTPVQVSAASTDSGQIPPHRELKIDGIHAYAEKTIAPGETIHFRVASSVPYELAVCRLGQVDDRTTDVELAKLPSMPPKQQPVHSGSYVHVERGLASGSNLKGFTAELWVRPWRVNTRQALVTQSDRPSNCTVGLWVLPGGGVECYLGDGEVFRPEWVHAAGKLALDRWQHIALTWDGATAKLWLDGIVAGQWQSKVGLSGSDVPLRLAAAGVGGRADEFLDGDLAMPALHGRALSEKEVQARVAARGLSVPDQADLLACWPLTEEKGDRVQDSGHHGRHGQIINHATWMIGGPSFDANGVPRYGDYDPAKDAQRGHGLRFASDDLYDCRWDVVHEYKLPADASQGIYIGRFRYEQNGKPQDYHVAFVVRRPAHRSKASMLVLCSTNTWMAYNATPFAQNAAPRQFWSTFGLPNSTGNPPAYSCYRDHGAAQPAYQFGLNMPWPAAGPEVLYSPQEVGYSHLMRGERFAHAWLDKAGYDYDVASDFDLDRDPALLDGYQVVVINGHSEYWSTPAYEAVERFLDRGGNLLVLSGNTMFWRVSFSPDRQVMECRKFERHVGASKRAQLGEVWHSYDGQRGGLMREAGLPAWKLVGLECLGWWSMGTGYFGVYSPQVPDHFLWHRPEEVGLKAGESFGHAADMREPRAVGHEADVRLPTIRRMQTAATPEGAAFPDEPAGITTLALGLRESKEGAAFDYFGRPTAAVDKLYGEMIYWERPSGGRVFNAGAIGAGWALSVDPKLQTLMRNVLHHFGITAEQPNGEKA